MIPVHNFIAVYGELERTSSNKGTKTEATQLTQIMESVAEVIAEDGIPPSNPRLVIPPPENYDDAVCRHIGQVVDDGVIWPRFRGFDAIPFLEP